MKTSTQHAAILQPPPRVTVVQRRPRNQNFPHSPETDQIIVDGYKTVRTGPAHGQRCTVDQIRERLKKLTGREVSKDVVEGRAKTLGVTRPMRVRTWTEAADNIIRRNAHLTSRAIKARLDKLKDDKPYSIGEINVRRRQLVGEFKELRDDRGIYTPDQLTPCLGVRNQTIILWIKAGWLKAEIPPCNSRVADSNRDRRYLIREKDLREFIIDNPTRIPMAKVDAVWFIALVANRLGSRCSLPEESASPTREYSLALDVAV